jgi:hypothetical protein
MSTVGDVRPIKRVLLAAAFAALAGLGACGEQHPTAPTRTTTDDASSLLFWSKPKLLQCGVAEPVTASAVIGVDGGTIDVGGASIVFPAGALSAPTSVTLTIPASPYVEVDIVTNGQNRFLDWRLRPIVTISYARCERSELLTRLLSAWYIDSDTKALLEWMPSLDNKLTSSVTFRASHFSGYAIAF